MFPRISRFFLLLHYVLSVGPVKLAAKNNEFAKELCGLATDQLIEHYGYTAEIHKFVTEDEYILTVFRCNSKQNSSSEKKPVILQHGIVSSSDDYCINTPNQSLGLFETILKIKIIDFLRLILCFSLYSR